MAYTNQTDYSSMLSYIQHALTMSDTPKLDLLFRYGGGHLNPGTLVYHNGRVAVFQGFMAAYGVDRMMLEHGLYMFLDRSDIMHDSRVMCPDEFTYKFGGKVLQFFHQNDVTSLEHGQIVIDVDGLVEVVGDVNDIDKFIKDKCNEIIECKKNIRRAEQELKSGLLNTKIEKGEISFHVKEIVKKAPHYETWIKKMWDSAMEDSRDELETLIQQRDDMIRISKHPQYAN